jgi:hypothetical protein
MQVSLFDGLTKNVMEGVDFQNEKVPQERVTLPKAPPMLNVITCNTIEEHPR